MCIYQRITRYVIIYLRYIRLNECQDQISLYNNNQFVLFDLFYLPCTIGNFAGVYLKQNCHGIMGVDNVKHQNLFYKGLRHPALSEVETQVNTLDLKLSQFHCFYQEKCYPVFISFISLSLRHHAVFLENVLFTPFKHLFCSTTK